MKTFWIVRVIKAMAASVYPSKVAPDCSRCKFNAGINCVASSRGYNYTVEERAYGPLEAFMLEHCGARGRWFEPIDADQGETETGVV